MLPQRHDKMESLPTEKMAWHAASGFTKLGLSRENCAADASGDADRVPAALLANLTPDPTAGTKRNSERVETYPRQRPRTEAASSPSPPSLRRDTSRRHRRYDIWVSQHQCRRDISQGWLSRTPLKWNSLVQGYRHTLYSAPLFPPGRGWGPFLAPSLSVPHSCLVRSHGHAPFDKPRLSTSLPSCERASSIRSTLARLLDSPSSDHRLPASFSGWKCNDRKRVSPRPCDESRSCQGRLIDHRSGQSGGWNGRAPRLRAHAPTRFTFHSAFPPAKSSAAPVLKLCSGQRSRVLMNDFLNLINTIESIQSPD